MPYKAMNVQELLSLMKRLQGDREGREFAQELGISESYLSDIYNRRREPGPSVLSALCLTRRTLYTATPEFERRLANAGKRSSKK